MLEQEEGLPGTGGEGVIVGGTGEGVVLGRQELVGGETGVSGSIVQLRE